MGSQANRVTATAYYLLISSSFDRAYFVSFIRPVAVENFDGRRGKLMRSIESTGFSKNWFVEVFPTSSFVLGQEIRSS